METFSGLVERNLDIIGGFMEISKDDSKFLDFVTVVLRGIEEELERVMWNITQEDYSSPFGNTGNSFRNEVFEVHAYDWGDDRQDYNFRYKDIEISWYKYLGRGMYLNREVSLGELYKMWGDCVASLLKMEEKPNY